MTLRSPNLDDRRFRDLIADAMTFAERHDGWRPSNAGDPGTILLELFAHLTETMLYRINRLPEKVYVELLKMIGVQLQPPSAAMTRVRFAIKAPLTEALTIPENTRISAGEKGPEFMTVADALLHAGESAVEVLAIHAKWVDYKPVGTGTGAASQTVQLQQTPLIAPAPERIDLIIAVEVDDNDATNGEHYRHTDGKTYRIWREVDTFAGVAPGDCAYRANRIDGTIEFAPALMQNTSVDGRMEPTVAVPAVGKTILARYRIGGGIAGNLAPNRLTKLLDKLGKHSFEVTNPARAIGGCDQESLSNALIRGPMELHSLQRAVTAQDFELIATKQSGLVNRAHAYTKRSLWQYAPPGTVEVILVPQVFGDQGSITPSVMVQNENTDVVQHIQSTLDERKPLGTNCVVTWCRYKSVKAKVSLTVHREENREAVKSRILERLYEMITPLAKDYRQKGWPFGKALGAYDIYRILTAEPGVKAVDPVVLEVSHVPNENVTHIDADPWQQETWYAAAQSALYRTLNNGTGWEQIRNWEDERVLKVKSFPRENHIVANVAGLVAVLTRAVVGNENALYLSTDCGETWARIRKPDFIVNDFAWVERNGRPYLLIATEKGLFEQSAFSQQEWKSITIDPNNQSLAARSITVATNPAGVNLIAVATPPDTGVYLCVGLLSPFKNIGLKSKIVEVLNIQYLDTHRYLWAGLSAVGDDPGLGCYRWQLADSGDSSEGWKTFSDGWAAGSCTALDFAERNVYAASRRLGLMTLKIENDTARWIPSNVNCGLPMEQLGEFEEVRGMAISPSEAKEQFLLAAGPKGIYRQKMGEPTFHHCSPAEFNDRVTLPATWLFCSAEHDVDVNYDSNGRS